MNWKWILFLTAVIAAVGVIFTANRQRDTANFNFRWKVAPEASIPVLFEPAAICKIEQTVAAPGTVEAEFKVEVSSQVPGRIERMPAKGESPANFSGQLREGDSVKKGQTVVYLDSNIYRERLRQNEALANKISTSMIGVRADLEKARRDFERNRSLARSGSVGSADVADMATILSVKEAQLKSTLEDLEASRATVAQTKKDLDECTIKSPMDGVVSRLVAEEGENVVVGTMNNAGTVIMTISDMNSIVVRARIDENYIPLVKQGQLVRIFLQYDSEQVVMGRIKRVSPQGEKGSQNRRDAAASSSADPNELAKFETLISIDHPPPSIRLGMTANVEIVVDERSNVLGVPPQAVMQRRAKDLPPELAATLAKSTSKRRGFEDPSKRWHQIVFVERDSKTLLKLVETGASDENRVEILRTDGDPRSLAEGDNVIVGPFRAFEKLKDGVPVKQYLENDGQAK